MDIKEAYQIKAEELAMKLYDKEYEELTETAQIVIYERAIVVVHEELQEKADSMRKELQLEEMQKTK